jgi:hypothetical protein
VLSVLWVGGRLLELKSVARPQGDDGGVIHQVVYRRGAWMWPVTGAWRGQQRQERKSRERQL